MKWIKASEFGVMKAIKITFYSLLIAAWCWIIVVLTSIHYLNKASFNYRMATLEWRYNRKEGERLKALAEKMETKGYRTLSLIPKFLRP